MKFNTMTTRNVLLIGGAAVAAYFLFQGGSTAYATSTLNFVPRMPEIKFDGITPVVNFKMDIQNPTSRRLTLRSIFGNLYINGQYSGAVSGVSQVEILPNAVTPITLQVRLSVLSLGTQLYDVIRGNSPLQATVTFEGTANYEGVPLPLKLSYKIV